MARSGVGLGSGARFADYLSAGLLARAFPSDIINRPLSKLKFQAQRCISLRSS